MLSPFIIINIVFSKKKYNEENKVNKIQFHLFALKCIDKKEQP